MFRSHPKMLFAACLLALGPAFPVLAHHSFVAKYDSAKKVRLSGTVGSVRLGNPHSYFELQTGSGSWTIETEGVTAAGAKGLTAAVLKTGVKASVTGWPARGGSAQLGLSSISIQGGPTISMRGSAR
jgi:hypothetical protein